MIEPSVVESPVVVGRLGRARRTYVLLIFALVSLCAMVDRHMLAVLVAPIQNELQVNDTMMGLLTGIAFALFYATAAVPIARYADRGNRRNLLASALALWSIATVACGMAANYAHLMLARIGVAAGEAASTPTIMSLIGSLYRREERAGAIGLMFAGGAVGMFLASTAASVLNDLYGWRLAFVLIGVPGIFLAALIFFTVPEPPRGADGAVKAPTAQEPLRVVLAYLLGVRTFVPLLLAKCMSHMAFHSFVAWVPTLLLRSHDMGMVKMGVLYGTFYGIGGLMANLTGGFTSDRLARRGVRWYLYFCVAACSLAIPSILLVLGGNMTVAIFSGVVGFAFMAALTTSVSLAGGLAAVKPQVHASMTASMYLCMNLVGAGLGPLVVGVVSDLSRPRFGVHSLRFGLLIVALELAIAAWLFLIASRRVEEDARKAVQ